MSDVVRVVESVVVGMDEGGQTVERMRVEVCLAKATNYGDCVRVVRESGGKREQGQWAFEVEGVKVMVLVGVNSYEREGRQPILVGFGVSGLREGEFIEEKAFGLEREVVDVGIHFFFLPFHFSCSKTILCVWRIHGANDDGFLQIIETTSFETLETLIEHVYSALRKRILDEHFPRAQFWINIAKPRAIAFADAPVVEIVRDVPCSGNSNGGTIAAAAQPVLCIRKPYQG